MFVILPYYLHLIIRILLKDLTFEEDFSEGEGFLLKAKFKVMGVINENLIKSNLLVHIPLILQKMNFPN